MTIKEKAKEYESNIGSQDYVSTEIEEAFIAGSEWMQSELIEKAVEWFKHQKEEIGISWFDDYEIRFREAWRNNYETGIEKRETVRTPDF